MSKWIPTLCFRKFRSKHTELSKLYWTHQLGSDCLSNSLCNANPDEYAVNEVMAKFTVRMLPLKNREIIEWLPTYLERTRLHLLIICAANLEEYLQEIVSFHLLAKGYQSKSDPLKLNEVGNAIGAPILKKDSLPEPLKYAQHLLEVDYGTNLDKWLKAYKLRSSAAHDGGVVTTRTLKDIPELHLPIDAMMGLSWEELKDFLGSAKAIATITDQKVSNYSVKLLETKNLIINLKKHNQLPIFKPKRDLWGYLDKNYGIRGISHEDRVDIQKLAFN